MPRESTSEQDEELERLQAMVEALGLELRLAHLGTPGQVSFATPVQGLDCWKATLLRDHRPVLSELGDTRAAAVETALGRYHSHTPGW
jgi:hypothetical protein